MPRRSRLFALGATYHLYCRVARGQFVFADPLEAESVTETLRDVKLRDGLSILARCLVTNHYHLVMKTESGPLWRSMARDVRQESCRRSVRPAPRHPGPSHLC
jgi:REP element-mobilizing transposase RayT